MKHGKITRSGDRTAQSSEFNVPAPRLRQSVFAVRVALGSFATATALQLAAPAAYALPTGEQLISGNATVSRNSSNTVMDINQSTQNAGFNWTSFSIAKPETVNVVQPNSSSVLLNRVVGNEQSRIFGALNANGRVFLVNPNGILFAPGASVNVGGLVASSLDMTKENFDSGKYVFSPRPGAPAAGVVNQAKIVAVDGYAALIGPKVANEGVIVARTVALAAGNRVALDMIGDGLISVRVEEAALGAQALNKGTISAEGGSVYLLARSADALLDTVVNNTGIIRANSLVERNGSIILDGGSAGVVANSGTLDVSGTAAGATGGTVKVLGEHVALADGTRINATGDAGGGTVLVGGNFHGAGPEQNATTAFVGAGASIDASAINSGNGGNVAVWSDGSTSVHGSIAARGGAQSGNGGLVETSGKAGLEVRGARVDTRAPNGSTGNWLLDPDDVTVVHAAATDTSTGGAFNGGTPNTFEPTTTATVTDADINNNLKTTNVKVTTTSDSVGPNGDITFDATAAPIVITNAGNGTSLTFDATHSILFTGATAGPNTSVDLSGATNGQLTLHAGTGSIAQATANDTLALTNTSLLMVAGTGIGSNTAAFVTTGMTDVAATTATGGVFLSNSGRHRKHPLRCQRNDHDDRHRRRCHAQSYRRGRNFGRHHRRHAVGHGQRHRRHWRRNGCYGERVGHADLHCYAGRHQHHERRDRAPHSERRLGQRRRTDIQRPARRHQHQQLRYRRCDGSNNRTCEYADVRHRERSASRQHGQHDRQGNRRRCEGEQQRRHTNTQAQGRFDGRRCSRDEIHGAGVQHKPGSERCQDQHLRGNEQYRRRGTSLEDADLGSVHYL